MHIRTALPGLALAAAVSLPVGIAPALAGESMIPPVPMGTGSSEQCALPKARFRTTAIDARQDKRAAFRAARTEWLADTADERAARRRAFVAADTAAERKAAQRTFRAAVADERAARQDAKSAARQTYRTTMKAAKKALHHGLKACSA